MSFHDNWQNISFPMSLLIPFHRTTGVATDKLNGLKTSFSQTTEPFDELFDKPFNDGPVWYQGILCRISGAAND